MNHAIKAPTFEIAQKVVEKLKSMGYKWRYGPTTKERLYWFDCKEQTTYEIENGYIVVGSGRPKYGQELISLEELDSKKPRHMQHDPDDVISSDPY